MALNGKFLRFCNVLGNYRNVFGCTSHWFNIPNYQQTQVAGLRQTLEEKFNIPVKPKRPLTPYFKYMIKMRPEIKKEKPNLSATDIVREMSVRWEKVDSKIKENLEAEYKKEQEAYAKERLEYDTKLTTEQKNILKQARLDRLESKEKRKLKKKTKEFNRPKKPCSPFVLFMKSKLNTRGNKEFKQFQKETVDSWQKMTDSEKKPYLDEVNLLMREYQKQMVEWERRMIKLGNTDIVRQEALIDLKPKTTRKKHD